MKTNKLYNHAFDIAFSITTNCPTGDSVTAYDLRKAILNRVDNLSDTEILEAVGQLSGSYEMSFVSSRGTL